MVRFLVVLALMKCATPSVIDPANHKTVSVPIGNGMSVDVDVTVDIDTAGAPGIDDNGGCLEDGKKCGTPKQCRERCCGPSDCQHCDHGTCHPRVCGPCKARPECTKLYDECETSSECCDTRRLNDAECKPRYLHSTENVCQPKVEVEPPQCIPDGEPCHGTDDWEHECCSESCCEGKCGKCWITRPIWN